MGVIVLPLSFCLCVCVSVSLSECKKWWLPYPAFIGTPQSLLDFFSILRVISLHLTFDLDPFFTQHYEQMRDFLHNVWQTFCKNRAQACKWDSCIIFLICWGKLMAWLRWEKIYRFLADVILLKMRFQLHVWNVKLCVPVRSTWHQKVEKIFEQKYLFKYQGPKELSAIKRGFA